MIAAVMAFVALAIPTLVLGQTYAGDMGIDPEDVQLGKAEYSPYLEQGYPDRVYFGDTHLHTSYSTDAGMFGTRLGPDEAYRFALGEEVTSSTGLRVRLQRPLDFLVVAVGAGGPLEADEGGELARLVVFLGGRGNALPHGSGDSLAAFQWILPRQHPFAPSFIGAGTIAALDEVMHHAAPFRSRHDRR